MRVATDEQDLTTGRDALEHLGIALGAITERQIVAKRTATVIGMADQHSPCSIKTRFDITDWDESSVGESHSVVEDLCGRFRRVITALGT